jgi:hypothetical protein
VACRIGVGRADFLVLAALPTFSLDLYFRLGLDLVLSQHILHVPIDEAPPAHIGADQRGIDVHHFGCGDVRLQAGVDRALEDFAEPLFAPARWRTRVRLE